MEETVPSAGEAIRPWPRAVFGSIWSSSVPSCRIHFDASQIVSV